MDRPTTTEGFNAGLMIIDIDWWRQHKVTESLFELTKEHHQNVYGDQGILNLYFKDAWHQLPWTYNLQVGSDKDQYRYGDLIGMMFLKGCQRLFITPLTINLGPLSVSTVSEIFGGFIMPYLGKTSY